MPIVTIQLVEGRSIEEKRAIVKSVTEAITTSAKVTPEKVSIYICEMKKTDFAKGGILKIDM